MPIAKVKQKGQVTIPAAIRHELALNEGDFVEVTSKGGVITITPKDVVDRHPDIDRAVDEGWEDYQKGRVTPAFSDAASLAAHLDGADRDHED